MEKSKVFCEGDAVEIVSKQKGFQGSYFEGTVISVLHPVSKLHPLHSYVVEYKNLLEEDCCKPLVEVISLDELRPRPPLIHVARFRPGDCVDAFDNDGWWIGEVRGMEEEEDGEMYYYVYFETFAVGIAYHWRKLRIHQDLKADGAWSVLPRKKGIFVRVLC